MATLAIAAGGALLGGVTGGLVSGGVGILLGAQIGFLGGSILGGILFPTEIDAGGPSRDDIRLSSAATGRFIPIPYGTVRVGGQYIWVDEPLFRTFSEDAKGGPEVKTTEVYLTWMVGICEGPVDAITRIWLDGELVFDISDKNASGPAISSALLQGIADGTVTTVGNATFDGSVQSITAQSYGPVRIYLGTDGQPEEPLLQIDERITEALGSDAENWVPPMNGLVCAVFEQIPGKAINNHFPQCEFEVMKSATAQGNKAEYEPVFDRSRTAFKQDFTTFVTVSSQNIVRWSTVAQNPKTPIVIALQSTADISGYAWMPPRNVGPWRQADEYVLMFDNNISNDSLVRTFSGVTGAEIGGVTRIGLSPFQPVFTYLYPDTEFPSHALHFGETTGEIAVHPVPTLDIDPPADPVLEVDDPQIGSIVGSPLYHNHGFFVGGLFYGLASERTPTENSHLFVLDPFTLEIVNAVSVTRTSPDSDDTFYAVDAMTYDAQHDKIILISSDGFARKFDRKTLTVDPEADLEFATSSTNNGLFLQQGPINGKLWLSNTVGNAYVEIDVVSMTLTGRSVANAATEFGLSESDNRAGWFDVINNGLWVQSFLNTDWLAFLALDRQSPNCVTAASIADDISDRVDVPSTLRDTSDWSSDQICGFLVGRRITGRKVLDSIGAVINGDYRTEDGLVDFIKLDTASIRTIPEADLGASESIEDKMPKRDLRWPYERELPQRIDVQYISRAMDYASDTVSFDRPLEGFSGRTRRNVQVPVVFTDESTTSPLELAERLLYSFDRHRETHLVSLTWEHLDLNVGDAFGYQREDRTYTVRVEKWALAESNRILLECRSEDVSINTPSGETAGDSSLIFTTPGLGGQSGVAVQFIMEPNLLRDVDGSGPPGTIPFLVAAVPNVADGWPGGQLLQSVDGGQTFSNVLATLGPTQIVEWGIATTKLADGVTTIVDRDNTVTVQMQNGIVGPVSSSDIVEDTTLNNLAIGQNGRWEIVRFETAVNQTGSPDSGSDTYVLSNLHRGMRGTEHNTANHVAGDQVIVLEADNFRRVNVPTSEIGVTRQYKLVTFGLDEALVPAVEITLGGDALKPYSPVHVQGTRNPSTGAWTFSWVRRTRVGGEWVDLTDVPLGEESEEYEVDILDGPGGSVVASKTGITVETVTFTESELLSLGSPDSNTTITVVVYQISAVVGRGHPAEATISIGA